MSSRTWSIVYWYSPVQRATTRGARRLRISAEEARRRRAARGAPARRRTAAAGRGRRSRGSRRRSARALALVVLAQRLPQAAAAVDRVRRASRRGGCRGDLRHQLVHVLELLQRRPARVALRQSRVAASATPRTSRRSPRRDGSARTSCRGAARSCLLYGFGRVVLGVALPTTARTASRRWRRRRSR